MDPTSHRIYDKPLMDKLGVTPESQVVVLGVADERFRRQLAERARTVTHGRLKKDADLIFFGADSRTDLQKLDRLKGLLKSDGAIWVIWLKGERARIRDVDVIAAAQDAGLVDNKVVSFSESHTALRLVIPVIRR